MDQQDLFHEDSYQRRWYYIESGKKVMLDLSVCEKINKENREGCVKTGGRIIYPVVPKPKLRDFHRKPATLIRDGQAESVRWYWQICEHKNNHYNCHMIDPNCGLCARKVLRYINWNMGANRWELEPMVNAATKEQLKVLD